MIRIYYLSENLFRVKTTMGSSFDGTESEVKIFCCEACGISEPEFELGMFELDGIKANVSDYGVNGFFIYSKLLEEGDEAA